MVDVCVDIETAGLDARKFAAGCLNYNGKKEVFYKKTELWNRVLEIGMKYKSKRDVVNVYAHNHGFDFLGYADLKDRNVVIYSDNDPFIIGYGRDREYIKFLDTYSLFPMSLKDLGDIIGMKKGELNEMFKDGEVSVYLLQKMIKENKDNMLDYLYKDTEIPLLALKMLRQKLKDEGVELKRLSTASQVATGYVINKLSDDEGLNENNFWFNKQRRMIYRTKFRKEVHAAYRGPRVECFKTGVISDKPELERYANERKLEFHKHACDYVDVNSLYPYSITRIRMPNLRTERKILDPLSKYNIYYILSKIGICRCMMFNKENDLGILPVRTPEGNYYPRKGKYVIGTYTNMEIKEALDDGYEMVHMEWCVLWDEMHNPFTKIYRRLYELRKSGNKFDDMFYKSIANNSIGKFAMFRPLREFVIDDVSRAEQYLDNNYNVLNARGSKYVMVKELDKSELKPYYMPIIPCLVNAYARIKMYRDLKKFRIADLVYTDTDSIIYDSRFSPKLDVSERLGDYKEVYEKESVIMFGKKSYMIGSEIKVSGIRKKGLTPEMFMGGYVENMKMVTLKTSNVEREAGSFYKEGRDLFVQYHNGADSRKKMEENTIYIDEDINDVENYLSFIKVIKNKEKDI